MQVLPIDEASAPVITISKNHTVVFKCHIPLSPLPRAGGFIEYVVSDLYFIKEKYGRSTYCLRFIIEEEEPSMYCIKVRPRWSSGHHPTEEGYYINSYLDMRMRETGQSDFRFHGVDWSVEAIHFVPSA